MKHRGNQSLKRIGLTLLSSLAVAIATTDAEARLSAIATPVGKGAPVESSVERLRAEPGVVEARPLFDSRERKALAGLGRASLGDVVRLELSEASDFERLRALSASGRIPFRIEANGMAVAMQAPEALEGRQWGLRNEGRPQTTAIDDVNSMRIQGIPGEDIGVASLDADVSPRAPVTVAVLDTGVDARHPDLSTQLATKDAECRALAAYEKCLVDEDELTCGKSLGSVDADGNGYPMDCRGWNVTTEKAGASGVLGTPDTSDELGHGTHVSGIIGAAINGRGIRGAASNVRVLPVKVIQSSPTNPIRPQDVSADEARAMWPLLDDETLAAIKRAQAPADGTQDGPSAPNPKEQELKWAMGFADVIARGMLYAIRSGAEVINLSLAWPAAVDSSIMREMVALARSRGVIVVASAGNDSTDAPVMPCHYDGVLCVGAIAPDGSLAHFSNFGPAVDVAAPGVAILSTWPEAKRSLNFTERQGYELKNGTSMASPFVAGAAARLLSAGIPAGEVALRLMASARPVREASYSGALPMRKHVAFGSADVARALAIVPRALIVPATKARLRLNWDRRAREIPLEIALTNAWTAGSQVRVRAEIAAAGLRLRDAEWSVASWAARETRDLSTTLDILDPAFDGRFEIRVTAEAAGVAPRTFSIPVEVGVLVDAAWAASEAGVTQIPVAGRVQPFEVLWTLGRSGGAASYLGISEAANGGWTMQILANAGESYSASAAVTIPAPKGELIWADLLDVDQNGSEELAFIFRVGEQGLPRFRFEFRDARDPKLSILRKVDYANKPSVVAENFQWLKLQAGTSGAELAPAWIGWGQTPELEVKPYDPWEPDALDPPEMRFYYLASTGLRTVKAPEGWTFLQLLTPSEAQKAQGLVPVLLGKGEDFVLDYAVAEVRSIGKVPEVASLRSLGLDRFRMLGGIDNLVRVTTLDGQRPGTTFANAVGRGAVRASFLLHHEGGDASTRIRSLDGTIAPPTRMDSIKRVAASFIEAEGSNAGSLFAESHYELHFKDLASGKHASTNLNRFSFLPSFITSRMFFPAVVEARGGGMQRRLPAVLIPGGMSAFAASEVLVPIETLSGELTLSRPAALRLEAGEGCVAVDDPIGATQGRVSQMLFFCGDRFVSVPLAFESR